MKANEKTEATENKIMTAQEVAQYLRLNKATIYRLAKAGEIPAVKVGRTWRFKKELMDEWFRRESSRNSRSGEVALEADEP
ncbi:MAG: helix-turn-helix domain-containing protein [Chloroflexi bacterium]|nr:helix-turn-helix domain-containing protein [Chloroflexota bacterium]